VNIRDILRITSKGIDITYEDDGECNHYFLLMVFGMKEKDACKCAYKS